MISEKKLIRYSFFFLSCLLMISASMIRSGPFYGKLDFLLLDKKPWWPAWKPMIEQTLKSGKQTILSDPMTSTVLRGVFGQSTIYGRKLSYFKPLIVEKMDAENKPSYKGLPFAALILLLSEEPSGENQTVSELMAEYVAHQKKAEKSEKNPFFDEKTYRCIINIQGFRASWVPFETRHWNPYLADTKWFYRYHYTHVADLKAELKKYPPENCMVFF